MSNDFLAELNTYRTRAKTAFQTNRDTVMAALASAGVATVTVTFDGGGDSGQIEDIQIEGGVETLPPIELTLASEDWNGNTETRVTLKDAIETMAYDCIALDHLGWENNDGAWGEIVFNVDEKTISLDINVRITDSESYTYSY